MLSLESISHLENCSIEEMDMAIWEIKEAIASRVDVEEVILLLEENGITLEIEQGERKICKKKRPDESPA